MGADGTAVESQGPAHWEFLGTLLWGVLIAIVFSVLQAVAIVATLAARKPGLSGADLERLLSAAGADGTVLAYTTFVTTVMCCALVAGVVKLKKHSVLTDYLALRPVAFGTLLGWIGVTLGFAALWDVISILVGRPVVPEFMSSAYATAKPAWILWVALVIAAPLFEETFFRGFLLKGFESSFLRPVGAVIVTATLWAAIHLQYELPEIASIFLLGLLLGAARVRTGSLAIPVAMHATSNLWATIEAAIL